MAIKGNPFDLTGRNIVITGAGGLMGRQFAYSLSEFGANLILLDINEKSINELADLLNQNFDTKVSCFVVAMSRNKNGGIIVNISSDLGLISPDQRIYSSPETPVDESPVKPVSYSVVKSGLLGLTRYLATYWPGVIRCNAICPGGIETDQNHEFIDKLSHR